MSKSEMTQSNLIEKAIAWFAEMRLPFPFIPTEMQSSLLELSDTEYGTATGYWKVPTSF
jgi:hypothetical protein